MNVVVAQDSVDHVPVVNNGSDQEFGVNVRPTVHVGASYWQVLDTPSQSMLFPSSYCSSFA